MTFEEELAQHGKIVFTNVGVSMLPLLRQGRDIMVIEPRGNGRMKKYDATLFKRDNGRYVIHRVLKVRENDYLICGDNCRQMEPVREDQILGVLTEIQRNGKTIRVTDKGYLFYVHLWCDLYPIRFALIWLREQIGRIKRGVKRLLNV